jgi:hypothetical protein
MGDLSLVFIDYDVKYGIKNETFRNSRKLFSITPLEDLKVAQEEGLGIYAMLYVSLRTRLRAEALQRAGTRHACLPVGRDTVLMRKRLQNS